MIDGAEGVLSFDDSSLVITTTLGRLTIEGEGMVIESLNNETGKIIIKGRFIGLYYSDKKPSRSFFR